jgi:hypothetical protein
MYIQSSKQASEPNTSCSSLPAVVNVSAHRIFATNTGVRELQLLQKVAFTAQYNQEQKKRTSSRKFKQKQQLSLALPANVNFADLRGVSFGFISSASGGSVLFEHLTAILLLMCLNFA